MCQQICPCTTCNSLPGLTMYPRQIHLLRPFLLVLLPPTTVCCQAAPQGWRASLPGPKTPLIPPGWPFSRRHCHRRFLPNWATPRTQLCGPTWRPSPREESRPCFGHRQLWSRLSVAFRQQILPLVRQPPGNPKQWLVAGWRDQEKILLRRTQAIETSENQLSSSPWGNHEYQSRSEWPINSRARYEPTFRLPVPEELPRRFCSIELPSLLGLSPATWIPRR